jgi:hypothetical protein
MGTAARWGRLKAEWAILRERDDRLGRTPRHPA